VADWCEFQQFDQAQLLTLSVGVIESCGTEHADEGCA
jgi:hypothetical protein